MSCGRMLSIARASWWSRTNVGKLLHGRLTVTITGAYARPSKLCDHCLIQHLLDRSWLISANQISPSSLLIAHYTLHATRSWPVIFWSCKFQRWSILGRSGPSNMLASAMQRSCGAQFAGTSGGGSLGFTSTGAFLASSAWRGLGGTAHNRLSTWCVLNSPATGHMTSKTLRFIV